MNTDILTYISNLSAGDQEICNRLSAIINRELPEAESKIWHGHPVWFLSGNPVVGFSRQKAGIRLMFWSGADFEEPLLNIRGGKFKDASVFYNHVAEVETNDLLRWLKKSRDIQWDYKNLVKKRGILERLK
jgi:hypothetical protein